MYKQTSMFLCLKTTEYVGLYFLFSASHYNLISCIQGGSDEM